METLRREEPLLLDDDDDDDAANDDDCRSARANIVVVKAPFAYYSVLFV